MDKTITSTGKKRNWATVCYPESVPKDWLETLKLSGAQVAISPLHDRDLEADEQTPKKAHWHIIIVYPGPKSLASMKAFCDTFGGVQPKALESVRGYYRYLTHMDDPNKAQYDEKDIITLNGFSILDFIELTRTEVLKIKKDLVALIRQQEIVEYSSLLEYLQDSGLETEFEVASNHTIFLNTYITSRRNRTTRTGKSSKSMAELVGEASGEPVEEG